MVLSFGGNFGGRPPAESAFFLTKMGKMDSLVDMLALIETHFEHSPEHFEHSPELFKHSPEHFEHSPEHLEHSPVIF